ncbi:MAG: ABC transporter substrate-binding protein [Oscillospiraceae bacterium]|jgi:NitT/TauT family transport system substrate-binding protein|nr:ABC transporter substrate-binding protein [Oscillospiraceae bacterium]
MQKPTPRAARILSLILAFMLLAAVFAGCGKSDSTDNGTSGTGTADATPGTSSEASPDANPEAAAPADTYVVKIAYGTALCHAPLHVAIKRGLFEAEGLSYEAVPMNTAATLEGAGTNAVDAGFGLIGKFAQPLENGLGIKLTAGIHSGCIKIVTADGTGVESVADLKGKIIGVADLADSPAVITRRVLFDAGFSLDEITEAIQVYSADALPAALSGGEIAAYAAMDPAVSIAVRDNGFKVLVDTAESALFAGEFCCATFVTDKFIADHPGLAEKYTNAILKAAEWIAANPAETAALQVDNEFVAGDAEFNGTLLATYGFHASVDGGYDSLQTTLEQKQKIGVLKADTDTAALLERGYHKF